MSQRKRTSGSQGSSQKRPSGSFLSSEEAEDPSFTQPSSTQVQKALDKLSANQLDQKTAEVVKFFLVKDQKKLPIRRADLVRHVVKEYKNVYPEIIKRAAKVFDQVFGFKLVEIDPKNHMYILVNTLETTSAPPDLQLSTNPKQGLLFVILSVIFMKGGVVRENFIWNILKRLRVDAGEKHEEFGDVKKLVSEEFVRQRYLELSRIPHTEPIEYEMRWGHRAEVEVSKPRLLDFIAELHDKDPQSWSQQYREAHGSPVQPGTSTQK